MEKALLITVKLDFEKSTWDVVEQEHELKELALTAGATIIQKEICHRASPTANYYLGEGKVTETAQTVESKKIDLVIFNNELTGTQHKNLENAFGVKVIDRTQLILDIFARRARSPEGKAQVELAQLEYLLPRLSGRGTELSRLGGGIGTRGPGEQKLEEDRRRIRERISQLKKDLKDIQARRQALRTRRKEFSLPTIALVGYTSAGKSTLFNALTGSAQAVSKGLFTTLDPLVRAVNLSNGQKVVLSDTVGFIRELPPHLVEAFKATLEEVVQADLLIHVLDITSAKVKEHYASVNLVLEELGAREKKIIVALNKVDQAEEGWVKRYLREYPESVALSALKQKNLGLLLEKMQSCLSLHMQEVDLVLPLKKIGLLDFMYQEGKVTDVIYAADGIHVKARLPLIAAQKLKEYQIV